MFLGRLAQQAPRALPAHKVYKGPSGLPVRKALSARKDLKVLLGLPAVRRALPGPQGPAGPAGSQGPAGSTMATVLPSPTQALATPDGTFSFGAMCTGTDCPSVEAHVVANSVTVPNNVAGLCLRSFAGVAAPYLVDAYNEWYQWNGTTFPSAAAPSGALACPSPYSPDKSMLSAPSTGSLINAAGTWTWGPACGSGFYETLLNSAQSGGGCGSEMLIDQDGIMYAIGTNQSWWQYNPSTSAWTNLNTTTTP